MSGRWNNFLLIIFRHPNSRCFDARRPRPTNVALEAHAGPAVVKAHTERVRLPSQAWRRRHRSPVIEQVSRETKRSHFDVEPGPPVFVSQGRTLRGTTASGKIGRHVRAATLQIFAGHRPEYWTPRGPLVAFVSSESALSPQSAVPRRPRLTCQDAVDGNAASVGLANIGGRARTPGANVHSAWRLFRSRPCFTQRWVRSSAWSS